MGRQDDQKPRCWVEREREMRGAGTSERGAILPVATEERSERLALTEDRLDPRHHRAAERPRNIDRLRLALETIDYGKRMCARNDSGHRRHETKP